MAVQSRTKTANRTSDGELVGSACVVYGMWFVGQSGGAGAAVLKDGGSGGTAVVTLDTAAEATSKFVPFPGGLEFDTDCYLDLTDLDSVTIFYSDD